MLVNFASHFHIVTWLINGADPSNPTLLLSLFNWAVQKTEVEDARAWYRVLAVDNPTAVRTS